MGKGAVQEIERMKMSKKRLWDIIAASFCIGLALFIIYLTLTTFVDAGATTGGPFANSAFYPRLVAFVIVSLSILLIISSLFKKKGGAPLSSVEKKESAPQKPPSRGAQSLERDEVSRKVLLAVAVVLIVYTMLLERFGYLTVTPFFMAVLFWLLRIRKWITIVLLSLISTASLYLFFSSVLEVILPSGQYSLIWW
jgi:hypothetical protein